MRNWLLYLLVLLTFPAIGQYPKHIIRLSNKANTSYSLQDPAAFLSQRAIERRLRYNISIDSSDLPVSPAYIDSIKAAGNVKLLSTSKWLNQVLVETTDQMALQKINAMPFVVSTQAIGLRQRPTPAKPDEVLKPIEHALQPGLGRTQNNLYDYGFSYNQVHIHEGEFLHNKGFRGEDIHIAVLDAGFLNYKNVMAFDSIRLNGQVLGEKDFVSFDNSVNEDNSHGMQCLSLMATNLPGQMIGTAPQASYWLIRTENAFNEFPIEEHNWVAGAEYADSSGSDVISSSLGYFDFDDPSFDHTYNDFYKNATMITRGATYAAAKGMIVMNSAGNEGNKAWKYIGFPADADSVCAVGAIDTTGKIAPFSSFGYPGKVKPNIVSVGERAVVATPNNQLQLGNGTSFANPNVAGLVACLWQAFPEFNNMKILDAVYRSSHIYASPDDRFGFGIPNFRIAYELLEKERPKLPVTFTDEWMIVAPNPFVSQLNIYLEPVETGTISLRLLDATGRTIVTETLQLQQNVITSHHIKTGGLPKGMYYIQYISSNHKVVKKVVKL